MRLTTLFGNAAGKALFISLAGACAVMAMPVQAANAASLADLYRTQFVVRNCQYDFNQFAAAHYGSDFSAQPEDTEAEEVTHIDRSVIGKLSRAVEEEAGFMETTSPEFAAIFDTLNAEIAVDVEAFCNASIPVADEVFSGL